MKLRNKKTKELCESNQYNIHSLCEIIVYYDNFMDSDYLYNYEVLIKGKWKDLKLAFEDRDIIPNNKNTHFSEPSTKEEQDQGYYG